MLLLKVIMWLEPMIQSKTSTWEAVNLKKKTVLSLSLRYGHMILVSGYLVLTAVN